ncbi:hypothetical protein VTO73DRAFT_47 [Trametes versicolor]
MQRARTVHDVVNTTSSLCHPLRAQNRACPQPTARCTLLASRKTRAYTPTTCLQRRLWGNAEPRCQRRRERM